MLMSSSKNKFPLLYQNSVTFVSVGFRPPCWCPSGWAPAWRLHKNSYNLGKTFLRISRIRNIPLIWILARVFAYEPPFILQILDLIYWTVLTFILIYFEWRDTENQQFHFSLPLTKDDRRSAFGKPLFLSIKKLYQLFYNIQFSPLEVARPYVGWIFS